jgi:hypothetical protein
MAKIIRITAKRDGFRRAGLTHSSQAVDHKAEDISAKQLAALKAEDMLVVQELDLPDAADGKGKTKDAK